MKQRASTIVFTLAVTAGFVAPISFVYLLTKPMVTRNEEVFLKRSVLSAAGVAVPTSSDEVIAVFAERVEEIGGEGPSAYRVKAESGDIAGYVFIRSGPGLWGEISAAVGFRKDLEHLTGVDFIRQSETPGLGARISESWFREQFRGKKGPLTTVAEGEPAGETEFDAITGATLTSNYVKAILNTTIEQAKGLVR